MTMQSQITLVRSIAILLAFAMAPGAMAQQAPSSIGVQPTTQQFAPAPMPVAGAAADYRVGPGDVLGISVYRSPDLTSLFTVGTNGTIDFPQLGPVNVNTMTVLEIGQMLEQMLKRRGILVDPNVNVLVSQLRARVVTVMGTVARSGEIPIDRQGTTLSAVLAQAGAVLGTGDSVVTIYNSKTGPAQRKQVRMIDITSGREDRVAEDGDVVAVQSPPTVYVSGEVGRAGAFAIEPNMTVGQAVAMAGGITPRGSSHRIRINRKLSDGHTEVIHNVKLDDPVNPDDLITVQTRIF